MTNKYYETHYRPLLHLLNGVAGLIGKVAPSLINPRAEQVITRARLDTGLYNLGNNEYKELMELLFKSVKNSQITALGRSLIHFIVYRVTVNRLRALDFIKQHPGVLDTPIEKPVFVVGLPRSGTTLLQNVLSQSPHYESMELWQLLTPYPLSQDPQKDEVLRKARARTLLQGLRILVPELDIIHHMRIDSNEECQLLIANSLVLMNNDIASELTEFTRHVTKMDRQWIFDEYKQLLQIRMYKRKFKRLVLKCPSHLWNLRYLYKVFPDAQFIWIHRHPSECVPSFASLMSPFRRTFHGYVEKDTVGWNTMITLAEEVKQGMAVLGEIPEHRVHHVLYQDFIRDIPNNAIRIKAELNMRMSPMDRYFIHEYLNTPRKDKPGRHKYTLQDFALNRRTVREEFSEYIEKFEL